MRLIPGHPAAFLGIAIIAMTAGCRSGPAPAPAPKLPSISGTIALEGANSVGDTAILAVRLVDLGREDSSRIIVEQLASKPGAFPQHFRLYYNQATLDFSRNFGIEVVVTENGRNVWEQTQPTPVLTKGRPEVVDITLHRAR